MTFFATTEDSGAITSEEETQLIKTNQLTQIAIPLNEKPSQTWDPDFTLHREATL